MERLSAGDLLRVWEWGHRQLPVQQALMLLSVACPEMSVAQLAQLSIGQRDARLLELRSHTFGPSLQAMTQCPKCTEALEYSLNIKDIIAAPLPPSPLPNPEQQPTLYSWQKDNYQIQFRLPTSADFLAMGQQSPEQGQAYLLRECLASVAYHDEAISPESVPDTVPKSILQALTAHMAEQDPQAEITLNLSCLVCGHQWSVLFDIVSFFWREIATAAQRLLQEVHLLASVYSWREADILSMSPHRRQAYIDQIANRQGAQVGR